MIAIYRMIAYEVDVTRGVVTTRVLGRVSFAEFANHLHGILRDAGFKPHFDSLIVAMDREAIPAAASVRKIKTLVTAWSMWRSGVRWAVVVPDDAAKAVADSILHDLALIRVTARCFTSEVDAVTWLQTSREGANLANGGAPSHVTLAEPGVADQKQSARRPMPRAR
jgi:hypothetical protein